MIKEKNKIKVILSEYGSLTVVSVPLKLYKDSFNFVTLECLVPKTVNSIPKSFVKVYANTIDTSGNKIWGSQTYNLPYEKNVIIDKFEYEVYCGNFPEEFCNVGGGLEVTFAYGTLNENDEFLSRLPSATLNLYISGNGFNQNGVAVAQHDVTATKVNQLIQTKVDKVNGEDGLILISDGSGGMKHSTLPIREYENQKAYIDEQDEKITQAFESHRDNTENPHGVTKAQVGLANVDNTSDLEKPISNAQQQVIDTLQTQIDSLESTKADKTAVTTEITSAIANVINSAPETLDTLKEVADWVAEHETDAETMVSNIARNTNDIANLQSGKVSWNELPEGNLLYSETGNNENGSLTQKKSTELFNLKLDKTEATSLFAEKLAKNQGAINAGRVLIVNELGEIVPSQLKITKTIENNVEVWNIGFVD